MTQIFRSFCHVRNNLAKQGSLKIGDDSVELNIHDLNGKTVSSSSIQIIKIL